MDEPAAADDEAVGGQRRPAGRRSSGGHRPQRSARVSTSPNVRGAGDDRRDASPAARARLVCTACRDESSATPAGRRQRGVVPARLVRAATTRRSRPWSARPRRSAHRVTRTGVPGHAGHRWCPRRTALARHPSGRRGTLAGATGLARRPRSATAATSTGARCAVAGRLVRQQHGHGGQRARASEMTMRAGCRHRADRLGRGELAAGAAVGGRRAHAPIVADLPPAGTGTRQVPWRRPPPPIVTTLRSASATRRIARMAEAAPAARPPRRPPSPDRNLALELVRVTEAAAHGRRPLGRPRRQERRRRRRGRRDAHADLARWR